MLSFTTSAYMKVVTPPT